MRGEVTNLVQMSVDLLGDYTQSVGGSRDEGPERGAASEWGVKMSGNPLRWSKG